MRIDYFGLICPQCNAGFPMGKYRPLAPPLVMSDYVLNCPRCGTESQHKGLRTWGEEKPYSAEEIAVAGTFMKSTHPV